MTEVDASIPLSGKSFQLDNPMDLQAKALQIRQLGLANQSAQRDFQNQQTLADLYRSNIGADGSVDHNAIIAGMAKSGLGAQIPAYQKSLLDVTKTQGEIGLTSANTGKSDAEASNQSALAEHTKLTTAIELTKSVSNSLYGLANTQWADHDSASRAVSQMVDQHQIPADRGAAIVAALPADPSQIGSYFQGLANQGQEVKTQIEAKLANLPKYEYKSTGGTQTPVDVNPLTNPHPAALKNTVAPDTAANITKDYAVAGLNPDGTPGQANAALVKMIGEGRMIPSDRLEATPRGQAVLAEVEKQYPGFDVTTSRAKQKAALDFGAGGKDGAALRSIGTATKHLDMLDGLVGNLDNTDSPAFNSVANFWKTQTGGTAPKTFDAAKQIVGQEVIKAIVAGGGGVGERQEAADALSKASSPAQLRSVIATYKTIMGAQHESLLQQRDAAGLPRSTLPDYTEGASNAPSATNGTPVPPDIAAILKKHGAK